MNLLSLSISVVWVLCDGQDVAFQSDRFYSLDEINWHLENWKTRFWHLVSVTPLTDGNDVVFTHEGRTIPMVKISSGGEDGTKKRIWVDAGIHGREWIAVAVSMHLINHLLEGYGSDPSVTKLVDNFDWYIIPVANPDGYAYTWTTDRMWRKNRNLNNGHVCAGVDVNRNFAWEWKESLDPCLPVYAGKHAHSEPETIALSSSLLSVFPAASISLHSYSQLLSYPFGNGALPVDWQEVDRVARKMGDAMRRRHGTDYLVGNSARIMPYTATGKFVDWAKGAGVKYTYVVELPPPRGDQGLSGFIVPASHIQPIAMEFIDGIVALAAEM